MKNSYILLLALFVFTYSNAQIVDIPDAIFKEMLVNYLVVDTDGDDIADSDADINNDGEIQVSEAEAVEWLDVGFPVLLGLPNHIQTLDGIEYFTNLKKLDCEINSIESINVTQLLNLEYLNCRGNGLTNLNVSNNPNLTFLWCTDNFLNSLNITQNPNLELLRCSHNQLTELDVTQNPNLNSLTFVNNQISTIDISQNLLLELIYISQNLISNLDLTAQSNLITLYCGINNLSEIDISNNLNLITVDISQNNISTIDLSQNLALESFSAFETDLSEINVIDNINLSSLGFSGPNITSIDITNNDNLTSLTFSDTNITTLDVSQNLELEKLYISTNPIDFLNLSQNSNLIRLYLKETSITSLNIQNGYNSNIEWLASIDNPDLNCIQVDDAIYSNNQECVNSPLEQSGWCKDEWTIYNENCSEPFVSISDTNFLNALVNTNCADLDGNGTVDSDADTNDDGVIQLSEAEAVIGLYVSNRNIISMEGVHSFINLTSLDVSLNQLISLNIKNGNSNNIINFNAIDNAALFCIEVDDITYANSAPNWIKDTWASFSEDCNLGVEDNVLNDFSLYPNPAHDVLNIESQQEIETVKIYNLQGQLIKEVSTNSIDVSNLNTGLYFVQVTIEGKSITKKFIKE